MNLTLIPYYLQNPPPSIDDSWEDMELMEAQELMSKVAVFNSGTTLEPCDSMRWSSAAHNAKQNVSCCRRLFCATAKAFAAAGRAACRTTRRAARTLKRSFRTRRRRTLASATECDFSDTTCGSLYTILEPGIHLATFA